jgi:hypothetical protein
MISGMYFHLFTRYTQPQRFEVIGFIKYHAKYMLHLSTIVHNYHFMATSYYLFCDLHVVIE